MKKIYIHIICMATFTMPLAIGNILHAQPNESQNIVDTTQNIVDTTQFLFDFDTEVSHLFRKIKGPYHPDDDSLSVVINAKIRQLEHVLGHLGTDVEDEIETMKDMDWDEIKERHKITMIREDKDPQEEVLATSNNKKLIISSVEGNEFGEKGKVVENELLNIPDLDYYPNPSHGRFCLKFHKEKPGPLYVKVYNIEGQEIFVRYFPKFDGVFAESIDLIGQPEGMYLMEISSDKRRLTRKILIQ